MLIAWSSALAVNVADINDNEWKKLENDLNSLENDLKKLSEYLHKKMKKQLDDFLHDLEKLLDDFHKARRHRLHALILAIVSLTISALSSFFLSRPLNALAQVTSSALLLFAFMLGLRADTLLISIFHEAALLNLKRDVIVKALERSEECSDEQKSTSSRQPCSTLLNRLAGQIMNLDLYPIVFSSYLDPIIITLISYIIEFSWVFYATFNLATRVLGLSIQLQPFSSTFSLIVPISASILLGLSQWSTSTAVRGLLEYSCTSTWLVMLRGVRVRVFMIFITILFLYVFSFHLIPISLTPTTGANDILWDSLYFGTGLGLLASLALEMMLLTSFRDFIHLTCSLEQNK